MHYRKLGKTGVGVSAIGLGTEYIWHEPKETVARVLFEAINNGVNYIDIFMGSPGIRDHIGDLLGSRRKDVLLAGHLGCIDIEGQYAKTRDPNTSKKFIEDFYARLRTDYIDVLFIHNIDENNEFEEAFSSGGIFEMALHMKEEGRARFIGLSAHKVSTAMRAISKNYIDVLMFPVNPAFDNMPTEQWIDPTIIDYSYSVISDNENQNRTNLYNLCMQHEIGIIAMKPYAGGWLFSEANPSSMVLTPVQCINYALSQPGVTTVVPGCKNSEEVRAALAYLEATDKDKDFSSVIDSPMWKIKGKCMYCNHCQPCPTGLDIGAVIKLVDTAKHGLTESLVAEYRALNKNASDCIQCGLCVKRCPFGVDVIAHMKVTMKVFEDAL